MEKNKKNKIKKGAKKGRKKQQQKQKTKNCPTAARFNSYFCIYSFLVQVNRIEDMQLVPHN